MPSRTPTTPSLREFQRLARSHTLVPVTRTVAADLETPVSAFLKLREQPGTAHVHGHCHQKAFGAFPDSLAALKLVPGLAVKPIASSCCGMAGNFGYQAETQEVSRAMAEASLLPAVRAAAVDDMIVADGTSCRYQIRDLSGRAAVHSVRVLERALAG